MTTNQRPFSQISFRFLLPGLALASLLLIAPAGCGRENGTTTPAAVNPGDDDAAATAPVSGSTTEQIADASDAAPTPADPKPANTGNEAIGPAMPPAPGDVRPVDGAIGPRLTFAKLTHDFGDISDVAEQLCSFEFTNTGDEELVINDIKASCGCTAATLAKKRYEPGEGSQIDIKFNPKGFGRQSKYLTIMSNSVTQSVLRLTIAADVTPFVSISPKIVRFGPVKLGTSAKELLSVSSVDPAMVIEKIKATDRGGGSLTARLLDEVTNSSPGLSPSTREIEVVLGEDAPWGGFFGTVTVTCRGRLTPDGEEIEHVARATVTASIFGELKSSETMFRLSLIAPGDPIEKSIRITRESGEPFEIVEARILNSSMPGVEVRAEPLTDREETGYDLILFAETGDYMGSVTGKLRVMTNIPGEEQLDFNFSGIVRESNK